MKRMNTLLALCLVALLALSGIAMAREHGRDDRPGDDHGHHARHDLRDDHGHSGRHHHHGRDRFMPGTGTIASFDQSTGKLTIALTDGESFSGLVTPNTEIKCEGIDQRRDHGGGDNSGPGSSGGGDDNGGHGEEPGDDNGGQFEPGDDHGGQGEEPGDDNGGELPAGAPECSTASLVTGATVGEAELRLEGGGAVFEEIELGNHS